MALEYVTIPEDSKPPSELPTVRIVGDCVALLVALGAARTAFENADFNKEGQSGNQRFKYANLASFHDATRKALSDNGVSLTFFPNGGSYDGWRIPYALAGHGAAIWGEVWVPALELKEVKDSGSLLSHHERYVFQAVMGIRGDEPEPEDNPNLPGPGTAQARRQPPPPQSRGQQQRQQQAPQGNPRGIAQGSRPGPQGGSYDPAITPGSQAEREASEKATAAAKAAAEEAQRKEREAAAERALAAAEEAEQREAAERQAAVSKPAQASDPPPAAPLEDPLGAVDTSGDEVPPEEALGAPMSQSRKASLNAILSEWKLPTKEMVPVMERMARGSITVPALVLNESKRGVRWNPAMTNAQVDSLVQYMQTHDPYTT